MPLPARVLVTGVAGFIGSHVAARLLDEGVEVLGLDDLNPYYDPALKRARLARLVDRPGFRFAHADLADAPAIDALFATFRPGAVVHLGAQVGVRYSLVDPNAYVRANLVGFANVAEACRHHPVSHLLFASSSSVYGANTTQPFAEAHAVDHPVSLYAATKRANELHAHAYAERFGLPSTGMRFFTVYGPWSRPDMAVWGFTEALLAGRPIPLYNHGEMRRDLTYVADVVEAVVRLLPRAPVAGGAYTGPHRSAAPFRVVNVGRGAPVGLLDIVHTLEALFERTAALELLPLQPGDVVETFADVSELLAVTGYRPSTPLAEGLAAFAAWWRAER
ncbi:MAG: NAD-dependent epimerase/dehydratase family protein [Pseudomonadota bacterium]|nr:NAD-dependent epimerase/dehydratase family protein [Pseudomonadota bacterium]